jgi:hypothetical protein
MKILTLLMLGMTLAAPLQARTFKWMDEHGKVHYGDTLPEQPTKNAEYNKQGRELRKVALRVEAAPLSAEEEQARRRDRALLGTYTNPDEIDLARDRSVEIIDLAIKGSEARMKVLQARMDSLLARQAKLASGKPLPEDLARDLFETQKEMDGLAERMRVKSQEQDEVRARYQTDRERFMQLSGAR